MVFNISQAEEKLSIEKQLVGIVGAISGTVKTETRELKPGDKIKIIGAKFSGERNKRVLKANRATKVQKI